MAAAITTQGQTFIRDTLKAAFTHVVISDDTTVFAVGNTGVNPGAGTTSTHASAATKTDVGTDSEDFTFVLDGTSFFTNKVINSIGVTKGTAVRQATGTGGTHTVQPSGATTVGNDTITRSLRASGLGIGVQSGDTFTVGVRSKSEDNS
jgi:uncharacterized cupin superfamily protein